MKQRNIFFEELKQENLKVLESRSWRQNVGRYHKKYERFLRQLYDYVKADKVIYGCGDMAIITAKGFAEENHYTIAEVKTLLVELALSGAIHKVNLDDLSRESRYAMTLVKKKNRPKIYNKTYLLINDFSKADWTRIRHWHNGSKPCYATVQALYGTELADNIYRGIRNSTNNHVSERYGTHFHDIIEQNKLCSVQQTIDIFRAQGGGTQRLWREAIDGWTIEYHYCYAKDKQNRKYIVKNKNTIRRSDNLRTVKKDIF